MVSDPGLATSSVRPARAFYSKAMSKAEMDSLEEALQVDGLDEEIAVLRLRLRRALKDRPKDFELMLQGAATLSRLVATKFSLSKGDVGALQDALDRAVAAFKEMIPEVADE